MFIYWTAQRFLSTQRLKSAIDKDKEIEYQKKILKTRLQALGIPTEDLEIK